MTNNPQTTSTSPSAPHPPDGQPNNPRTNNSRLIGSWAGLLGASFVGLIVGLLLAGLLNGAANAAVEKIGPCNYTSSAFVASTPAPGTPIPGPTADDTLTPAQQQQERRQLLIADMNNFYQFTQCLYRANNFGNLLIRFLVIAVALLSTVAAQFASREDARSTSPLNWKTASVFLAAMTTALAAFQAAFPFADRALIDQTLNGRVDNLLSEMRISPVTPDPYVIFTEFEQIKSEAAGISARPTATPTAQTSATTQDNGH